MKGVNEALEVADLMEELRDVLKQEQPTYKVATLALFNLAIGMACDAGMREAKIRGLFSHLLNEYLQALRKRTQ
jgi:hypothetical protein